MKHFRRENNNNWRGGIYNDPRGYRRILMPDHPRADCKGYVYEHWLLAEKALGKSLPPKSEVHHHSPEQLVICENRKYHFLLHTRARSIAATGNAHSRYCCYCNSWKSLDEFVSSRNCLYGKCYTCKKCQHGKWKKFESVSVAYERGVKDGWKWGHCDLDRITMRGD